MQFGKDHVQTAGLAGRVVEQDVGTPPGHVGRDGDRGFPPRSTPVPGLGDQASLFLVVQRVEHGVGQAPVGEPLGEELAGGDRARAHEHRPSRGVQFGDRIDDGVPLGLRGAERAHRHLHADERAVGLHDDHGPRVDLFHLAGCVRRRAGHAAEERIGTEEPLEAHAGECLAVGGDGDVFFGLDGLVQAVLPRAVGQESSCVLIDDHDAPVHDVVVLAVPVAVPGDQRLAHQLFGATGGPPDGLAGGDQVVEHLLEPVLAATFELGLALDVVDLEVGPLVQL